jgi:hypothetical protein
MVVEMRSDSPRKRTSLNELGERRTTVPVSDNSLMTFSPTTPESRGSRPMRRLLETLRRVVLLEVLLSP